MPFPGNSFTIHGGCNCGSIRYRISVPPSADRPIAPYHNPEIAAANLKDPPRVPVVLLDHCNDCRRATSSMIPMALVTETKTVEISFLPGPFNASDATEGEVRTWQPVASVIDPFEEDGLTPNTPNMPLGHYISSPNRNRWFCKHCGTPIAYSATYSAYPAPWKAAKAPRMFDIWLGTLDREWLEREWMRPDHAVWCHFGIDWVADLAKNGARRLPGGSDEDKESSKEDGGAKLKTQPLPRHPLFMVDQPEGEDVSEWLDILKKMKSGS